MFAPKGPRVLDTTIEANIIVLSDSHDQTATAWIFFTEHNWRDAATQTKMYLLIHLNLTLR